MWACVHVSMLPWLESRKWDHMPADSHADMHICTYSHMLTCPHAHMPACWHAHMHIFPHAHISACPHAHMPSGTHADMLACTYSHMPTCWHAHMHIFPHAHMLTAIYMHIFPYAHMPTRPHADMHICTYSHMPTCPHALRYTCWHAHIPTCPHAHMLTCPCAHLGLRLKNKVRRYTTYPHSAPLQHLVVRRRVDNDCYRFVHRFGSCNHQWKHLQIFWWILLHFCFAASGFVYSSSRNGSVSTWNSAKVISPSNKCFPFDKLSHQVEQLCSCRILSQTSLHKIWSKKMPNRNELLHYQTPGPFQYSHARNLCVQRLVNICLPNYTSKAIYVYFDV